MCLGCRQNCAGPASGHYLSAIVRLYIRRFASERIKTRNGRNLAQLIRSTSRAERMHAVRGTGVRARRNEPCKYQSQIDVTGARPCALTRATWNAPSSIGS